MTLNLWVTKLVIKLWVIKAGLKVFAIGMISSLIFHQVSQQTAVAASHPSWVPILSAVLGPLVSVFLAFITMRRMIRKDHEESEEKLRQKELESEATLHSSMADITHVAADERSDARAAMLQLIDVQRKEREQMQLFYADQLKQMQGTIELQRAFIEDVKMFKQATDEIKTVLSSMEAIVMGLLATKTSIDPFKKDGGGS